MIACQICFIASIRSSSFARFSCFSRIGIRAASHGVDDEDEEGDGDAEGEGEGAGEGEAVESAADDVVRDVAAATDGVVGAGVLCDVGAGRDGVEALIGAGAWRDAADVDADGAVVVDEKPGISSIEKQSGKPVSVFELLPVNEVVAVSNTGAGGRGRPAAGAVGAREAAAAAAAAAAAPARRVDISCASVSMS